MTVGIGRRASLSGSFGAAAARFGVVSAVNHGVRSGRVTANGIEFGVLEVGSGPLALCLHGFPDSAHTWRYLLPELARAGFRAVAPFMRGYAPTPLPSTVATSLALSSPTRSPYTMLSAVMSRQS
jgi:pimeloyl-ACP methyl ester carboxylesterase